MIKMPLQTRLANWSQEWLKPTLARQRISRVVVIASLSAVVYWGFLASDRFVSEAHIIIQKTDLASGQTMDFGTLLAGAVGGNKSDQLLLRDNLLSMDTLNKLDAKLDLRAHYSDSAHDLLSRLWFKDTPQERFHQYFLSRVSIEFDDYAGVLVIKAQGYDPKTAHAITSMLVEEGERTMNALGHRLANEQVAFVEKQVVEAAARYQRARQAVLAYQNRKGMVSPQSTAENLAGAINRLDLQRTELQTRRNSLLGYLSENAPSVAEIDMQIAAIEKQMSKEQARLTSPGGKTLNRDVEEFQRLEMAAAFAQDVYKTALMALEQNRVEATRTLKKVSLLQSPTFPQYPMEPRRIYNITVFILLTLLLAGVAHLLAAIIRDHKD